MLYSVTPCPQIHLCLTSYHSELLSEPSETCALNRHTMYFNPLQTREPCVRFSSCWFLFFSSSPTRLPLPPQIVLMTTTKQLGTWGFQTRVAALQADLRAD